MGKKGRPVKSQIRQNMVEILFFIKHAYGYDIYKSYIKIFPKVTLRSIYYHLKKGVALGEFKVDKIEKQQGEYSWGGVAEKIYYGLGDKAEPKGDEKVKEFFDTSSDTEQSSSQN
tara:strand:+ start:1601 stop:1945 length:345 start_codon:yes stop_codon:yes gene_type:complete